MRTSRIVALAALLALAGCNLTLDPDSVKVKEKRKALLGACAVTAGGHQACGGLVTQGAGAGSTAGGHRIAQARVTRAAIPRMSSAQHQVLYSHVSQ